MHTCCAPCSVYCIDKLREEWIEPTAYWYNPNIHPYKEFKRRLSTLREYASLKKYKLIVDKSYPIIDFVFYEHSILLLLKKIEFSNNEKPTILNCYN